MARKEVPADWVIWENLTIRLDDGRGISGSYGCSDQLVTAKIASGSKTTQIGGSPSQSVARIMLRELAEKAPL